MLLPEHGVAAQALALLALPLLGGSVALAAGGSPRAAIGWSAFQASAVAGVGVAVATLRPSWDQALAALLTLLVQAAALPLVLYALESRRSRDDAGTDPDRGSRAMGTGAIGLIVVAFLFVPALRVPGTAVSGPLLPTTVALWLVGAQLGVLGADSTRRAAGLLSLASGLLLLGLASGTGLCPLLALGFGLDTLVLARTLIDRSLLGGSPQPEAAGGDPGYDAGA